MKHWLPPALILTGLLSFCFWDAEQMKTDTLRWHAQLQQADRLAVEENWSDALKTLEDSYADWKDCHLYVHIVIPRDAADDAEAMYLRAIAFARTEEISEFRAELSDLQNQLRVLQDMESFRLRTIF